MIARARRRDELTKQLERLSDSNAHGVLLSDAAYGRFTLELLKQAQHRVWLMMFFFRFEDEKAYATDAHMAALLAAKARGLDVRVILDRQEVQDPRPSWAVNANAYRYLQAQGIPVVLDSEQRVTHSKVVLVDDCHVVVGSHNWTAGSLFAYRDTSVYVDSTKVSSAFRDRFEALFQEYSETAPATA